MSRVSIRYLQGSGLSRHDTDHPVLSVSAVADLGQLTELVAFHGAGFPRLGAGATKPPPGAVKNVENTCLPSGKDKSVWHSAAVRCRFEIDRNHR